MASPLKGEIIQKLKIFRVTAGEDKLTSSVTPLRGHPGDNGLEIRPCGPLLLWDRVVYSFKVQLQHNENNTFELRLTILRAGFSVALCQPVMFPALIPGDHERRRANRVQPSLCPTTQRIGWTQPRANEPRLVQSQVTGTPGGLELGCVHFVANPATEGIIYRIRSCHPSTLRPKPHFCGRKKE